MTLSRSAAVIACIALTMIVCVSAQAPVFEHKQSNNPNIRHMLSCTHCYISIEVDKATMDCEICQAVVRELARTLDSRQSGKKGREMAVFQAMVHLLRYHCHIYALYHSFIGIMPISNH
jgi:hypothetical protein